MFENCTSLTNIEIVIGNKVPLKYTERMFKECINIKNIDLEGLNTTNTLSLSEMFYGCQNLEYLNIYNFNTARDRSSVNIFKDVPNTVSIVYNPKITSSNVQKQIKNIIPSPS
jgi:surface protein